MRHQIHTRPVKFMAPPPLVEAAENRALEQGLTLSEFLRRAVRREVREAA